MNMLYALIPLALLLIAVAAWALIWAIRGGQFDDLDSQGWSVVLDDDQKLTGETASKDVPEETSAQARVDASGSTVSIVSDQTDSSGEPDDRR